MEENKAKERLYIPQGLKQKREYYEGFGKHELIIFAFGTIIGGVIDLLFYFITNNLIASIFIMLAIPTTIIMCVTKDTSNISVVDQLGFMIRFSKSQKKYSYISQDEWR